MMFLGDFVRRENPDATFDLICTNCFQTVAHGKNDSEFEDVREKHSCEPLEEVHRRFQRASMKLRNQSPGK